VEKDIAKFVSNILSQTSPALAENSATSANLSIQIGQITINVNVANATRRKRKRALANQSGH
jgi:hypothetical protein